MKTFYRIVLLLFLVFPALTAKPALASIEKQDLPRPEFTPVKCEFELPANLVEGKDVHCGTLTVPLKYSDPGGEQLKLAVATIRSIKASPEPDPLIMEQGGPGGSTIDIFLRQFSTDNRLRSNRDVILLEQRGTLYSTPNLMCPEIDQLTLDTLDKDLTQEEAAKLNLQAITSCHDRLVADGIDLSAFDSLENARDLESLRLAMGYDEINLYGVSYGTLLALHYMKLFPDNLRSVILDGVLPPQVNYLYHTTSTIDQSLKRLFAACQADAYCQGDFPDLEGTLFNLVDQFNQHPATFPMTDPDSGKTYQVVLDGDSFLNGIAQMMYSTSIIPAIPRMIVDARDGEFDFFSRIMSMIVFDRTVAYGMYYSVLCAEDADFTPDQQVLQGVDPTVAEVMQRGPQEFLESCKVWKVEALNSSVDQPVSSDVPTLLLSGAFDPVTPPEYAELVAQNLSRSFVVTFPNGGHGQAFEGECQDGIILDFLEDPTSAPDTSCIQEMGGPGFYTSKNVINAPFVINLITLDQDAIVKFIILCISACFLFTAVPILPLSALFNWLNRPRRTVSLAGDYEVSETVRIPYPARLNGWLAFTVGLLAALFLIALIVILVSMVANNDNRLMYGLAIEARPWLYLPPIIFILSLTWLLGLFQAWKSKAGSLTGRIYHTFLISSALAYLVILALWGLLFNIF